MRAVRSSFNLSIETGRVLCIIACAVAPGCGWRCCVVRAACCAHRCLHALPLRHGRDPSSVHLVSKTAAVFASNVVLSNYRVCLSRACLGISLNDITVKLVAAFLIRDAPSTGPEWASYDRTKALWAHRAVFNLAQLRFSHAIVEIRSKGDVLEATSLELQERWDARLSHVGAVSAAEKGAKQAPSQHIVG